MADQAVTGDQVCSVVGHCLGNNQAIERIHRPGNSNRFLSRPGEWKIAEADTE
jgi:hypothetical protein